MSAEPDPVKRGVDIAVGFIAFRMRSEAEVRRRLRRADLEEKDIEAAVERLKEMSLVDDRAFAGAYSRDQMLGQRRGPERVRRGLSALGVERSTADAAIDEVLAEHDLEAQALSLAEKRWRRMARVDDTILKKKRVYEYLVRLGYPFNMARRIVDRLERSHE